MLFFRKILFIALGLLIVGFAAPANAQPQSFTITQAPTVVNQVLTVNQFNMPGFILNSVSISMTSNITTHGTIHNNTSNFIVVNDVQFGSAVKLYNGTGSPPPGAILLQLNTFHDYGVQGVNPNATLTLPTQTASNSGSKVLTTADGSNFSQFVGAGTVQLTFYAGSDFLYSGPSNVVVTPVTQAGGTVTITYTFSPNFAPEPGTWALFLSSASTGLVALRRRRRSGRRSKAA